MSRVFLRNKKQKTKLDDSLHICSVTHALNRQSGELSTLRVTEAKANSEAENLRTQDRAQRAELGQLRQRLGDAEQRAIDANRNVERLKKEVAAQSKRAATAAAAATTSGGGGRRGGANANDESRANGVAEQTSPNSAANAAAASSSSSSSLSLALEQQLRQRVQQLEAELKASRAQTSKLEHRQRATAIATSGGSGGGGGSESTNVATATTKVAAAAATSEQQFGEQLRAAHRQLSEQAAAHTRLEKTLAAENRLKVDLFRALTESKAQIEALNAQLRRARATSGVGGGGGGEGDGDAGGCGAGALVDTHSPPPLPSSLVASLANGLTASSPIASSPVGTPSSVSPHSALAKSTTSINDDLDGIFAPTNGHSYVFYCCFKIKFARSQICL